MDKFYTTQPFGNTGSLDNELAHDPGNSSHWSLPHPGYGLTGPVDAAVYQSAQLAYPESSQRTIVSPNAYFCYGQVRATPQLSVAQQLSREAYELGHGYYTYPYDYPTLPSLTDTGTYEGASTTAHDEGMESPHHLLGAQSHIISPDLDAQSTHSPPGQQATMQSGYVTSHSTHTHTPVGSDEVDSGSLFFESGREAQFGSSSDSVKDGSEDGEGTVCIQREEREG